jgi:hypothetical protein
LLQLPTAVLRPCAVSHKFVWSRRTFARWVCRTERKGGTTYHCICMTGSPVCIDTNSLRAAASSGRTDKSSVTVSVFRTGIMSHYAVTG